MKTEQQGEQNSQEELGAKQELEEPTEQNLPTITSGDKDYFDLVFFSVLGFICAIVVLAFAISCLIGLGYLGYKGYDYWLSTESKIEVGESGYYYDMQKGAFYKVHPNRCVLDGCEDLKYIAGDTIGIVCVSNNKYRYINLNTLTFLNNMHYSRATLFKDGKATALANDTLYVISPDGQVISSEPSNWVYSYVRELTYKDRSNREDDLYYHDTPTGVYMYCDANYRYGLMSSDFKRLTPAIYSEITPQSVDVFFCEYMDSGLGVLIDRNGKTIK